MSLKRTALQSNPETTKVWQQRTQQRAQEQPVKPRKALPRVSAKGRQRQKEYSEARAQYLECNPLCARCAALGRTKEATQVHHKGGREGDRITDDRLFMAVCASCHEWIHANPAAAREAGYLVSKNIAKN